MNIITRRQFIKHSAMYSALGAVAPQFLTHTAEAAVQQISGFDTDRVLVVVQLGGGNDGLNTVVPYGDDAYHNARPNIGLEKDSLLKINDYVAFNKQLAGLKGVYDDGHLGVIQGIGYPNPDRSHFRSMEIWHTASDSDEFSSKGWIGHYFDHECSGSARPQVGLAFGKEQPQAFNGEKGFGVSLEDPSKFGWRPGKGIDTENNFAKINEGGSPDSSSNIDFLRHVTSNAIMSSNEVQEAASKAGKDMPAQRGGKQPLNRTLAGVASLIKHELATRIYYVSIGGFDTHANQKGAHANLMTQVSQGLSEFQAQLKKDNTSGRVTTMIFSEFGRRVKENLSGGTDHGTAAPMFLMGENVNPGLHGAYPSLTDLDKGDLKFTTDFRSVYAAMLNDWFRVDSKTILGNNIAPLDIIS
jgi:uncharacterized protein (DUF1501 family)